MTRFCKTHVVDRTMKELLDREQELYKRQDTLRAAGRDLGPKLKEELLRVSEVIDDQQRTSKS